MPDVGDSGVRDPHTAPGEREREVEWRRTGQDSYETTKEKTWISHGGQGEGRCLGEVCRHARRGVG